MRYQILFLSSWFPNKIEPTNGNFVQRHAEAVSLLHNVEILHAVGSNDLVNEKYLIDDKLINGIRTLIVYFKNTRNPIFNFIRRMKAYNKGYKLMKKPDLVHANILYNSMLFALYLKMKFKISYVVTEHWSIFLKIDPHQLSKIQFFTAELLAKNAAYILPVSEYLANDLQELNWNSKIKVIGNVVDTDVFKLKEVSKNKFVFLHISNLVEMKNPDKIIAAAVKLSRDYHNFELHIGGDGNIEKLEEIVNATKSEKFVKLFGALNSAEVAQKMNNSSCFVMFSDYENFPCVLLESISTGLPAIATNVGGISEIINHKRGVLISNDDDELFQAMKNVLENKISFDDPEILHEHIKDNFSMNAIAQKFDQVYQEILG